MDTVSQVLDKMRFSEPPEIARIKQYVRDKYNAAIQVTVHPDRIVVTASSAALAGTLRMELAQLQKAAQTSKQIVLRISG